jgi:3'(2'), 5'-bisphosphate nucleotidase
MDAQFPDLGPFTSQARFAAKALRLAAELCTRIRAESAPSLSKADRSPVTVADFTVQAVVAGMLEGEDPDVALVAEEDSAALRAAGPEGPLAAVTRWTATVHPRADAARVCRWIDRGGAAPSDRMWTLDPIDGTKGFLRGDQYAIALAYLEGGQVKLGGLACPGLALEDRESGQIGALFLAARGRGGWLAPLHGGAFTRVQVSGQGSPAEARLLRSYEAAHTNVERLDRLVEVLGTRVAPLRMDSQAKYAQLARGWGDAIIRIPPPEEPDYRERIWDHAAGAVLVEEAGGRISDLSGRPLDFGAGRTLANNRGVLASNGRLHDALLRAAAAIGAAAPPGQDRA